MNRIIITPTFRPHFPFNRDFLQSYAQNAADAAEIAVHFIVVRDELADIRAIMAEFPALDLHAHAFEDLLEASGHHEDATELLREIGKFAYQSLKKLYALKAIDYDHALVLDSEALILKPVRVADLFDEYYADPFVLYSDLSYRGDAWFGGQSDAVVKNAARLLRLPYPNLWFLEYYGWFYDKRIVRDLFAAFAGDLLPEIRTRLKNDTRVFENQLFYHFVWANAERYQYRFSSVQDMLHEYLGDDGYAAYMRHFAGGWQQTGLFEMVSKTVTERNVEALERLFTDKHFRFYRFELLNRNDAVQRELIDRTPITVLVSSEGYRRTRERIAVCLSGIPHHPRQNLRFIRNFLAESNVDVFFHFWQGEDEDFIVSMLEPKAYLFEPGDAAPDAPRLTGSATRVSPQRAAATTSMFYSVKRANELKRAYEEEHGFRYDVVVRMRADFFSTKPLVDVIEHIRYQQTGWERTLYLPDMAHGAGINDQLALGTSDTMDAYASMYDHLEQYASGECFDASYMLARVVLDCGLRVLAFPYEYLVLRGDVIQTFDLHEEVRRARESWRAAVMPPVSADTLPAYLATKVGSVAVIASLALEAPKVFRLRGADGYVRLGTDASTFGVTTNATEASLFYLIAAGDDDVTAVNIRPRDLVLAPGATRESRATRCNLYPEADGGLRPNGPADEDATFFVTPRGEGHVLEWAPGFWKTPSDPRGVPRRTFGGWRPAIKAAPTRTRLALHASRTGLRLEPLTDATEAFVFERVQDAVAEGVEMGVDTSVTEPMRTTADPLVVRVLLLSYLAARTYHQRGPGAAKEAVSAFVRRRAHHAELTNDRGVLSAITRGIAKRL